jgi:hypothetical protein
VRLFEHAGAEARYQVPRGIEFLNRREVRPLTALCAAAIEDPNTGAVAIDVDADGLPPDSSLRKLRPVLDDMVRVGSAIGILRLNPSPARANACKHSHAGRGDQSIALAQSRIWSSPRILPPNCSARRVSLDNTNSSVRSFADYRKRRHQDGAFELGRRERMRMTLTSASGDPQIPDGRRCISRIIRVVPGPDSYIAR